MAEIKEPADKVEYKSASKSELVLAPSTRVFTRWTPSLIEQAKRMAENGDLSQAVLLCDWLLTDDRVKACYDIRCDGLFALDVSFESAETKGAANANKSKDKGDPKGKAQESDKPEDTDPKEADDTEDPEVQTVNEDPAEGDPIIAALDEDWDRSYPESEQVQVLTWGRLLGVAPWRHETTLDAQSERLLPCPIFWHPGTLRQDRRTEVWYVRDINGVEHILTPGDGAWGLFTPYGKRRPWSRGDWQALADLVLLKQMARQDWSRTSEKSALLVGEVQMDKDGNIPTGVEQRADFVNKLSQRGGDAVAAMPAGWTLKLLQVADNFSVFQEQVRMLDDAIAIVIRGGNLTSNTQGGSRAAADTQAAMGELPKRRADGKALSTHWREQSLVWWAAWNWGNPQLAPYPLWAAASSATEVDYGSFANGLKTLQEAGFILDVDVLRTDFGLTFVSGFDEGKMERDKQAQANAMAARGFGGPPGVPGQPGVGAPGEQTPDAKPEGKPPAPGQEEGDAK
jgi:hypothetical protein